MSNPVHARTQVVSVLFIDLVAFSKESTASQHTIKVALIQHLIAALTPIPTSQYLMRDTGDGAFVAFKDTPEFALYTVLALWRSCTHGGGLMPLTLERLRVGLHMGTAKEVLDVEGRVNYVGDGINTAKRIQDLAEPGQMVASRNFFDAFAHLDADYSRLFARSGSGNDQHGRSYELFALSFDEEAFSKLSQEMLQNFNNLPLETSPEHQGVGGAFTQVSDFIRKWFIPVNALLFSTTFYISNVGKIANQSLALRYTGLALLVLAVAMGLASWWLLSHRGGRFAARHPRIVNLFRHKPVTLLSLGLGLVLTVGAWVIDQPIGPLQEAKMESPTKVAPVLTEKPVVPSAPVVLANTLPTPRAALPSTVTPLATAIGDSPTMSRSATLPRVAKDGKLLNKVSSFNPRCSTLLQKASAGEPFSPQEQSEMVSTCQ